jgi:hypothetical protein
MKIDRWDDEWLVTHIGPWWFCGRVGRIGLKWSMTGCWWRQGYHLLPIGDFVCDNGDRLLELVEKILKAPRDYMPARAIVNGTVAYEGHLWGARRVQAAANMKRGHYLAPVVEVKTFNHHLEA